MFVSIFTFSNWQLVTIWFWSTVSTRGSINACFLMQLMSKPYTLFQTGERKSRGKGKNKDITLHHHEKKYFAFQIPTTEIDASSQAPVLPRHKNGS